MRDKYNGGEWTRARFNSFVKSALRSASKRWPPKYETINSALVGTQVNSTTGRLAKHYRCAKCDGFFPAKAIQVDHKDPIIPLTGFTTWDEVIDRMFCEKENLQVLCVDCHKIKTAGERLLTKQHKETNER